MNRILYFSIFGDSLKEIRILIKNWWIGDLYLSLPTLKIEGQCDFPFSPPPPLFRDV